jgi:uncharacterized membrane protein
MNRVSSQTKSLLLKKHKSWVYKTHGNYIKKGNTIIYGPFQFVVIGLGSDTIPQDIVDEMRAIRQEDIISLVDLLFVAKDEEGNISAIEATDFELGEVEELGAIAGSLLGLGAAGLNGSEKGEILGEAIPSKTFFNNSHEQAENIADQIPTNSSVVITLFEHTWAIGLTEYMLNSGGWVISHGMVTPAMLMELGADMTAQD